MALRGRIVVGFQFLMKGSYRQLLEPGFLGCMTLQRPMSAVLVVMVLPVLQLLRKVRTFQIDCRIKLFEIGAL